MSEENEPVSDYDYGVYSPHWMLRALLYYVPHQNLWNAVNYTINYMAYNEEPDAGTALDILAQVAVNGSYRTTYPHDCSEHEGVPHSYDPTQPKTETVPPLTEEEIQVQLDEFLKMLGPDAKEDEGE